MQGSGWAMDPSVLGAEGRSAQRMSHELSPSATPGSLPCLGSRVRRPSQHQGLFLHQ